MYRTLRAFAWMRWRILVNSFERTGARDRLERLSIATEQLGPIVAAILLIPSVIALSGMSLAGGYMAAAGRETPLLLQALRYLLLGATALSVLSPVVLPAADRTNAVRLLLLPISRGTLYVAQAGAALSDPWVLLTVPIVLFVAVGLAAGGALAAAVVALVAGTLLLLTIVGITMLATSLLHVVVRDRRRGELLALFFVVVLPLIGALPAMLETGSRSGRGRTHSSHEPPPAWVVQGGRSVFGALPSELYFRSVTLHAADRSSTATPIVALAAIALALHAAGLFVYGKVLASPGTTGFRKAYAGSGALERTLPLASPAASAVALSQLRLALRTPRGRSILLSPLIVFVMFGVMARRAGDIMDLGFTTVQGGLGFASFGCFISLLATLPMVMNQFAVDRAGLTLSLLLPLSDRDLLRGKAIGNGLIAFMPALLCLAGGALMFGGGTPGEWLSIPLGMLAAYLIVAPVAAALSAMFPRTVDMNSIGRASNAHGVAVLVGMASYVAGAAPSLLLAFLSSAVLDRPALLPILLALWCGAALLISRLLFIPAERIFHERRENLGLVA